MKFQFLLPSLISFCLLAAPAMAGQLANWNFNQGKNRLNFRTDASVQPKAIMLFNPTRLIIDLPGINFRGLTVTRKLTGNFRFARVGQFDATTARIVLEIQPGFTLDPKRVKFVGENPAEWYVDVPVPERGQLIPSLPPRPNSPR